MNLDRITDRIRTILVVGGGLFFAVFCGMLAGGGNFQKLGLIFTVLAIIAVCMSFREKIWTLIPFCWAFSGKLVALPIPVTLRDLAVIVIFVAFFAFRALKIVRSRMQFTLLEGFVVANVIYVATMFVRNPVGAKAFGSEMVGGRPYWDIAIATLGFWILASAPSDRKNLMRVPLLYLLGTTLEAGAELIGYFAPSVAGFLGEFYSGFGPALDSPVPDSPDAVDPAYVRFVPLGQLGILGAIALCSYYRPLTLFVWWFWPIRAILFGLSMVGILLSGYRTAVLKAAAAVFFGTYFRERRVRDFVLLALLAFVTLVPTVLGNGRVFRLPVTAQRALSFLPGDWDSEAVRDAKDSAQWRYDMWHMVLTEDKWIQNKWLGDGFGFTKHELGIMETMRLGGPGFLGGAQQELFMIVGSFHNGPLSAVRYGGVVGLILLLALMLLSVKTALGLIKQTRNTPMFPVTLFMVIPTVYVPLEFTFMVGGYDSNMPVAILTAGFLALMRRTFAEEPLTATVSNLSLPETTLPVLKGRPVHSVTS